MQAVLRGRDETLVQTRRKSKAGIAPADIEFFLHGTTVATNAVLEGKGARVGLITTEGYRHIMQIARSFVPGGLAAWIIWPKPQPLAALENTVTVKGRMNAEGQEVRPLDEADVRTQLTYLKGQGVEAITVSLINAYASGAHEARIGKIAAEVLPGILFRSAMKSCPKCRNMSGR